MTNREALERIKTLHVVAMSMLYDGRTDEEIKNAIKVIEQALDRLEELEKIIEDIKQLPNCDICDREMYKGCSCLKKKIKKLLKALKTSCRECEKELAKHRKRCPWRSISGDYCDEYEAMRQKLKELKEELGNE